MTRTNGRNNLSIRPWILFGMLVIAGVFGAGGAWATFARISGAVIASGSIGVETKVKTVQHLDGGIVSEIYVRDGDVVSAGAPLLRIDETAVEASLNIVNNSLFELIARKARLEAEQYGADIILFPDELHRANNPLFVSRIIESKAGLFNSRRATREGQKKVMREKILQLEKQIRGLEAQVASNTRQIDILSANITRKEPAAESGIVSQDTMDQLYGRHADLAGEHGQLQNTIARVRSQINETELQVLQIDVDFREEVQSELREVTNKIAELREQRSALEDQLVRTLVVAPVSGRIHDTSVHTVGGVVSPAAPIMQIIPDKDRLIVEARVRTTDIDLVYVGQSATVNLSAFDARTTPVLSAHVVHMSAAQLVDQATNVPYFSVALEIPDTELAKLDADLVLLPGMPAEAFISTGERTPLDYLLKPFSTSIMKAFRET
ncbi:HlyD family type I secretion periplasmic adaptor subunit [Hoeflea poritis]|uniref:Membrane fusion protein (MFP) family protein n=1 Tax=Hoeflea poritis TaxID=2993659 RepID=A0ABT4VPZ2_9HYPH|nr:HlyD family type I secretion periplasmic adaptor subunit [Hoeflea poritis]MDA4846240.1 HlyD family type I secretion periplasmic adaptor subunit [Hoeflea poritis]